MNGSPLSRARRILLWILAGLCFFIISALIFLQLPWAQDRVFRVLQDRISEKTGLRLDSAEFSYRVFPARLRMSGLRISDEDGREITIAQLDVTWKYRHLLNSPPRLGDIVLRDIAVDPMALPQPRPSKAENTGDPWEILQFDRLDLKALGLAGSRDPVSFRLENASIHAALISEHITAEAEAAHLVLEKQGRGLDLGRVRAELAGQKPQIRIRSLGNESRPLQIEASADITTLPDFQLQGKLKSSLDPGSLLSWWDPDLAENIQASGRVTLGGEFSFLPSGGMSLVLRQQGAGYFIAGLGIGSSSFSLEPDGTMRAEAAGPAWGRLKAQLRESEILELRGTLDRLPASRLLKAQATVPEWLHDLAPDLRISGDFSLDSPLPPSLENLEAQAHLEGTSSEGKLSIDGSISEAQVVIRQCTAEIPGASMSLQGRLSNKVALAGRLEISSPALMKELPGFSQLPDASEFGGGPIGAEFQIDGTRKRPRLSVKATWQDPLLFKVGLDHLDLETRGFFDALSWKLEVQQAETSLSAEGHTSIVDRRISGTYRLDHFDLSSIPPALKPAVAMSGLLAAKGHFEYSPAGWKVGASLDGQALQVSGIDITEAKGRLDADSEHIGVDKLEIGLLGGAIGGSANFDLEDASLQAVLSWDQLQPQLLEDELSIEGSTSGKIQVSGDLESPRGDAQLNWSSAGMLSEIQLSAQLEDGRIRVQSENMESGAGPLSLRADLPVGELPRPEWLMPSAPGGTWRMNLIGSSLRIAPLIALTEHREIPIDGTADLDLAVQWSPSLGGLPQLQAEIDGLVLQTPVEVFHSPTPIRLGFDGEELVLGKTSIEGSHSQLDLEAKLNVKEKSLQASLRGSLSPSLAELAPFPAHIDSPVKIEASLDGPIATPTGTVKIEEGPGLMVLRDPPLQIEKLRIEASFSDGVLDINDGHARINGGETDLGGGWDPTIGQGLVAEFENLSFLLPNDILSRWDGAISIEPSNEDLAVVVGELNLLRGLWERPFDLAGAMRDEGGTGNEETGPADLIRLDLEVHGRGGVHVNNNLGNFDLQWNSLQVTGTASEPRIIGDLHILPGGILNLPGKQVPIRRGLAQFTGDPMVDPLLEIVPDNSTVDVLGSPSSISSEKEATGLAKAGLSTGLSAFLGLSNTTIRPEDIAANTESDTSTEFSIGQQLGQSTALFLTTDLRDSQRRTTLFQVWQLPYLPDLTIQAQTRTDTGESDLKLLQRFSWGGTDSGRARLEKVHFKGKWPISKFKLRSISGLRPGQSWDPFLLFTARVRLEEALAKRGYPDARVDAEANEDPDHPEATLRCTPGPRVMIRFLGDGIPRKLRARARSLYRFPPLERSALEDIRNLISRRLWSEGFADAEIEIETSSEEVRIKITRGPKIIFQPPEITGLPDGVRDSLLRMISSPAESASIRNKPARLKAQVRRALAYGGYRAPGEVTLRVEKISKGVEKLHISIDPGPQAHLDEIVLEGADPLGILKDPDFPIKKGISLDRRLIDTAVSQLRKTYRAKGYTEIRSRAYLEEISPKSWRLRLRLEPGSPKKILVINFHGLKSIREKYLRKNLSLHPGSIFLLSDLDDSISMISRFSPVKRVDADLNYTSDGVIIDFKVEEADRWTFELGGGWNSDRGSALRLGIRDDDLLGRGLKAAFRSRWERDFKEGRLILTLPPLPGGHFALGLNTSYTEDYVSGEDQGDLVLRQNTGQATLDATWQLKHGLFLRGYYRFTRTHQFEEDPIDPFFPIDFSLDLATLGSQIILDHLDDPFDPRSGAYLGLDLSWSASELGSDTENIRSLLSSSLAISSSDGAWTWFESLRLGGAHALSGRLDPTSRFFAGGPSTIRGFRRDSVGPSETLGDRTIYVGGGAMIILNEEIRFPLWQSLRGAVFIDGGQVWEDWSAIDGRLSAGAGFGLRWTTPIGPLWLDVAWPVIRPGTNSGAQFSFGIGRTF